MQTSLLCFRIGTLSTRIYVWLVMTLDPMQSDNVDIVCTVMNRVSKYFIVIFLIVAEIVHYYWQTFTPLHEHHYCERKTSPHYME